MIMIRKLLCVFVQKPRDIFILYLFKILFLINISMKSLFAIFYKEREEIIEDKNILSRLLDNHERSKSECSLETKVVHNS